MFPYSRFLLFLVYHFVTNLALYLSVLALKTCLILKIHLQPIILILLDNSARSQTSLSFIDFISSFIELSNRIKISLLMV